MNAARLAPEILQVPVADIDASVARGHAPGTPEFEQAVLTHYALHYADRGWQAAVTVDDRFVRVVAVPEQGIEPKEYVLGLLQNGFLEDALPLLEALDGMLDDADIAYNHGICLSELGRVEESVEPLRRCLRLDPGYTNAQVGLGVACMRLGRSEEALAALRLAVEQEADNSFAQRNLAAVLARSGHEAEALVHFRRAVALAPDDPGTALGLAQCLHALEGEHRAAADAAYRDILERFADHPIAESARKGLTRLASEALHAVVDGKVRMDAVFYMLDAMKHFDAMSREQAGAATMEVLRIGEKGLRINDTGPATGCRACRASTAR